MRLSEAQKALARVYAKCGPAFNLVTVERYGLMTDYRRARKAGYFQSAGIEATVEAEDWLNSEAGRRALKEQADE